MSGWVAIDREIFGDQSPFSNEPMSEREAFIWMKARARFEDGRHKVGKVMMDVPRGSFMATLREMQSAFMWRSDTKVRNFLKRLEGEGLIERTTVGTKNAPKTHVTICNYDIKEDGERTKNAPKTHRERTKNAVNKKERKKEGKERVSDETLARETLLGIGTVEVIDDFLAMRVEMRKPVTARAARAMVKKIGDHPDPDAVFITSTANNWQGIFPHKVQPRLKAINGGQHDRPSSKSRRTMDAFTSGARGTC